MFDHLARFLFLAGLFLILLAGGFYLFGRLNLPLGRLPGDIHIQGKNFTFYFPLATSLLLSVILTLVLNLLARWKR